MVLEEKHSPSRHLRSVTSPKTPILRLYAQHKALLDANSDDTDRMERLENQIMRLPSTCAADFAAKAIVDTGRGSVLSDWHTGALWAEARSLTE